MERRQTSAQRLARVAGVFYLLVIVVAMPGILALSRLLVPTDAAATAANLVAHGSIVGLAFAGTLLSTAAYVVVTGLFYWLFRPVSREVSLVAALFSLVGCASGAMSALLLDGARLVLLGTHAQAMGAAMSQDVALLFTELFARASASAWPFFGFYCLLIGWLIFASGFLPRLLGVGMAAGGFGYLTYLWPPLAHSLFPLNVIPGLIGESALTLWLLFKGVDELRWIERSRGVDAEP